MISVCMASYNGEKYIKEQIDSILSQLSEKDELIISDDHSTDCTVEIICGIKDNRIKLLINNGTHGYTGNFYNALSQAKGDYIFLSDQDDVWCSNKIEKMQEYLRKYNFVVSDCKEVDAELNILHESRIHTYGIRTGFLPNLIKGRYIGCCMAFDRNVLKAIFPVPTYTNNYPHDIWIALIGEMYFKSFLIKEPLMLYRRHGNNASNGGVADKATFRLTVQRVLLRFYYFYYVIKQSCHIRRIKKEML